jgi:hypothetical protein
VALVPTAAFSLTPDQLYFEHSILSEGLFAFVIGAALLAAAPLVGPRPVEGRRRLAWAAASGGLLALAVTIRVAGIFAIPVVALALLAGGTRGLRRRAFSSLVLVASAAAVLLSYAGLQRTQIDYLGLTQGGPWSLYARVAPFADCERFTPPSGTEGLCERSDWRERPGPDFYAWNPTSPGHRHFGGPPRNADKVGAFARAALVAQPGLYVRAVAKDLVRYVDSSVGFERPDSGGPPHRYALDGRYAQAEAANLSAIRPLYGDQRIEVGRAVRILAGVQEIVRVHGVLVLLSALGLVAGVAAGRRHLAALLLVGGTSTVPIAMSTATTIYDYRYAVPFLPFILGSGVWGFWLAAGRIRRPREPIAAAASSAPNDAISG